MRTALHWGDVIRTLCRPLGWEAIKCRLSRRKKLFCSRNHKISLARDLSLCPNTTSSETKCLKSSQTKLFSPQALFTRELSVPWISCQECNRFESILFPRGMVKTNNPEKTEVDRNPWCFWSAPLLSIPVDFRDTRSLCHRVREVNFKEKRIS